MSKKSLYIIIAILSILLLGCGAYYIYVLAGTNTKITPPEPEKPYITPELVKEYENTKYHFSLKVPYNFNVRENSSGGSDAVILEDQNNHGIQILVSPYDTDKSTSKQTKILTADMIKKDIPDMDIREVQEVEIGIQHKGVAFKSNNESFDGASREVWFVFKGNLYQISTYEKFDDLLKQIFMTWKFE